MKQKIYHIIIFLLFWFGGVAYSQNPKADILREDLSGLFDNSSMIGILGAVSYTHLDVYKRQGERRQTAILRWYHPCQRVQEPARSVEQE